MEPRVFYFAKDDSLVELMSVFNDYYSGFIKLSAAAKKYRVYGSFPLDDLPATLSALRQSLPIKIRQLGTLFILIEKS